MLWSSYSRDVEQGKGSCWPCPGCRCAPPCTCGPSERGPADTQAHHGMLS
jgi:hypothetical protein